MTLTETGRTALFTACTCTGVVRYSLTSLVGRRVARAELPPLRLVPRNVHGTAKCNLFPLGPSPPRGTPLIVSIRLGEGRVRPGLQLLRGFRVL
eukprot:5432625-Prymnesium_polylepis.1